MALDALASEPGGLSDLGGADPGAPPPPLDAGLGLPPPGLPGGDLGAPAAPPAGLYEAEGDPYSYEVTAQGAVRTKMGGGSWVTLAEGSIPHQAILEQIQSGGLVKSGEGEEVGAGALDVGADALLPFEAAPPEDEKSAPLTADEIRNNAVSKAMGKGKKKEMAGGE